MLLMSETQELYYQLIKVRNYFLLAEIISQMMILREKELLKEVDKSTIELQLSRQMLTILIRKKL